MHENRFQERPLPAASDPRWALGLPRGSLSAQAGAWLAVPWSSLSTSVLQGPAPGPFSHPCSNTDSASTSFQVILARQYGSEGRFTFTSHTPGEHQICLHSNSTKFSLFAGGMLVSGPLCPAWVLAGTVAVVFPLVGGVSS